MEFSNLNRDKGVAGLTILLAVITMLFVIGLLTMIFALMGDELKDATQRGTSGSEAHFSDGTVLTNDTAVLFVSTAIRALDNIGCSLQNLTNHTTGVLIGSGNYTISGTGLCYVTLLNGTWAPDSHNGTTLNSTFTYTYSADTTASGTIENATDAVGSVTDWFDIFIVITAMVVLILLTVIIITAIRSSGLLGSGGGGSPGAGRSASGGKPRNVGSA